MSDNHKDISLNPSRLKGAEFQRAVWTVTVEDDVKKDDLLIDQFWAHVAHKFRQYDKIEVRTDDARFFAELLVIAAERNWAKVIFTNFVEIKQNQKDEPESPYEIAHKGPHMKFCVIRKSDRHMLKEGCQTRKEASEWLESHIKAISKQAA
jgi:hypothetical protein